MKRKLTKFDVREKLNKMVIGKGQGRYDECFHGYLCQAEDVKYVETWAKKVADLENVSIKNADYKLENEKEYIINIADMEIIWEDLIKYYEAHKEEKIEIRKNNGLSLIIKTDRMGQTYNY